MEWVEAILTYLNTMVIGTAKIRLGNDASGNAPRLSFALPDLRGRVAIQAGYRPGLTARRLGESGVTIKPLPNISFAEVKAAPSPRLAIGYWDGMLASSFVDARSLEAADERLAGGVSVRVVGCCGSDGFSVWDGFRSVSLGFSLRPFHDGDLKAWHYQSSPVVNTSPLASVTIPLDTAAGLAGWIEYREIDERLAPSRVPFQLGFGTGDGFAKLRSGYYVLIMRKPGSMLGLDWSALQLRVVDGGNAISLRDTTGRELDLPHILLEVDPA